MSRASRIIAVLLAAALGAGAAGAPAVVRARVERGALRACEARTGLRCSVGAVHLAGDGVLLRDLAVRDDSGTLVRVQRVAARWNWLRVALRRTQGVSIRVSGVRITAQGSVAELRAKLRPQRATEGGGTRRLRVDTVRVDDLATDLRVATSAPNALHLRLTQGTVAWSRGGPAVLRWPAAVIEHPRLNAQSGRCEARLEGDRAGVSCEGFSSDTDVATAGALSDELAAVLRSARGPAAAEAGDGAEGVREAREPLRVQIVLHGGTVRLANRGQSLVNLAPANVELSLAGSRVDQARLDVGAEGAGEASISLLLHRPTDAPWRLALSAGDLPLRRLAPWVPGVPWHGTDRGTARAQLRVSPGSAPERYAVEGNVTVQDFGIDHRGLAREPVDGLGLSLEGRVELDLARRRVTSPGVDASVNGVRFSAAGWFERDATHTAFDASLRLPQMDCDAPRVALPAAVVGPLANFAFAGTLAAEAQVRLDSRRLADMAFDFRVDDHCMISRANWELDVRRFSRPFVQRATEPGGVVRAFITGPGSPAWVPFTAISPFVPAAVVVREDGNFYRHHGFSPDEVRGALVRNVTLGRFAYGASTITMQLVKNVFLAREKTLARKLQEVALTWWIEQALDKTQILELYLNVVEFGPGIYGIGPAARFFFGVEPRDLTILQSIYLATLLPAPVPRFAIYERGSVGADTLQRLRQLAQRMAAARLIDPADAARAREEGLAFRPTSTPPPGAATWTVDAATTDEAAQAMVERAGVRVNETPPAPEAEAASEGADDGPRGDGP